MRNKINIDKKTENESKQDLSKHNTNESNDVIVFKIDKNSDEISSTETKEVFSEFLKKTIDAICEALKPLTMRMKEALDAEKNIREVFLKTFAELIISDKEKEIIVTHAKRLANKSVAVTIEENVSDLINLKTTKKAIDSYYKKYSRGPRFAEITRRIEMSDYTNGRYHKEAITTFKEKRYLSCAMVLLALIDSYFLKTNKDAKGKKHKLNRKLTEEKIAKLKDQKEFAFSFFTKINNLLLLGNIFSFGDNFENEPNIINRNYLLHGFCNRKVTKNDCVMLFIICSNLDFILG